MGHEGVCTAGRRLACLVVALTFPGSREGCGTRGCATVGSTGLHDQDPFPGVTSRAAGPDCPPERVLACASDAPSCMQPQVEYWGDVMLAGDEHLTDSAQACCAACAATRGCNTFVWCAADNAGCARQCWLKWQPDPRVPEVRAFGRDVLWTSGTLLRYFGPNVKGAPQLPASSIAVDTIHKVQLRTPYGNIAIRLRPDWSPNSARYVAEMAAKDACTAACNFYRAEVVPPKWGEDGFWGPPYALLQGGLRGLPGAVPKNPGETGDFMHSASYPPIMKRGMLAWAGGGQGPDFFISMASHDEWGLGHTVWGEVDEESSMHVVETILALPTRVQPGAVTTTPLRRPVSFSIAPFE